VWARPEIREFQQKLIHNSGIDGLVDPRDDLDITRIETNLHGAGCG
jgi:hypothetical protein